MVFHQVPNSMGNFNYNSNIFRDIVFTPHFHGNYELIYVIEGSAAVSVNGMPYTLGKDLFLLISPYSVHSLNIDKNSEVWIGVFSFDYISEFSKKNRYIDYKPFKCTESIEKFLNAYLISEDKPEHYMCISCLNAVCSECIKKAEKIPRKSEGEFTERVIKFITENLTENITLKSAADKLGYEYHYFSSLFHSCFGLNFKRFINMLRFEYACNIISDKTKSITEISDECGFDTVRNFNRVFKELSSYTPSQYREKLF